MVPTAETFPHWPSEEWQNHASGIHAKIALYFY